MKFITIAEALARTAGRLNVHVSCNCCLNDSGCRSRMSFNNESLPDACAMQLYYIL
jgi:hypothetical protein